MTPPLAGLRVVDLTRALAGPYCAMMLGDLGADVIKVEQPGKGDESRGWGPPFVGGESSYFLSINRNKRSIALDLKSAEGKRALAALLETADVLVENFSPGVMAKLGFGAEAVLAKHSRLIYCSISGFGQAGPHRDRPAYDLILQGMGGLMSITGPAGGPPTKVGVPIADLTAGMFSMTAIMTALYQRERTGRGQHIDTSLLDGQLALLTFQGGRYFATGDAPGWQGNEHPSIAPYETFKTADGYINVAVGNEALWAKFCQGVAGLEGLSADPRFTRNADRLVNRPALIQLIEQAFGYHTTAQLMVLLQGAGVPCGPIYDIKQAFTDPHVVAQGLVQQVEHPTAGTVSFAGPPYRFSDAERVVDRAPPRLGEHTAEVLAELGLEVGVNPRLGGLLGPCQDDQPTTPLRHGRRGLQKGRRVTEFMDPQSLLAKRKEFMLPTLGAYYERPMNLVKGEMQHLFDSTGKRYLDFFAGICTVSVGHSNPHVNGRVVEQVGKLQHTSTVFLTEPMVHLAEKLAQITPGPLKRTILTNSGTEANEYAVLLAKRHTGRQEIVALKHAYHGRSWLAASLTAIHGYRVDPMPVPGISFAQNPYCYRCPFGQKPDSCGMECANDIETTIQTQTTGAPAVFIAETIQGVGGIVTPPADYFKRAREITNKYGMLLHIDEVQAGFGRTGDKWFGIEHYGVEPDIMTMAKGMGNGYAIGGCITTDAIADSLKPGTINTFGGNPISSVASLATIEYMEQKSLLTQARELGSYLMDQLKGLQESLPIIGEVRGMGLMIGVELVLDRVTKQPAADQARRVLDLMKDDGVIIGRGGLHANVLRLQPPMVITRADCDELVASMKKALETVSKQATAV